MKENIRPTFIDSNEFFDGAVYKRKNKSMIKDKIKRLIDLAGALIFFAVFGWLYVVLWLLVIFTSGSPAHYKHPRVGKDGKVFNCLKFRSMIKNSEEVLKEHLARDEEARKEWEKDFKLRNDPRITKIGKIFRKTSLDELPQFWNVLRGEMSLVGPRPVTNKELTKYYGAAAEQYKKVRPGITGPWQVSGRNDLDYSERIKLDEFYAAHWSIKGDIKILFKTVLVVALQRGSY